MSSSSSQSASSGTDTDEDFGLPVATQPLPTPQLQGLRIRDHVLVVLDYEKENYGLWRRQFLTALAKFGLTDHVDGSRAQGSSDWVLNDFAIVSWYNATVTPSTLEIVEERHDTAYTLWRSLRSLFRSNRDARATYLRDEFHSFNQGDLSVVDYTSRLKQMADALRDLGCRVKERDLVHNVLRGLDERLQHAVPHVTRGRLPTFIKLRSFLLLEEQRLARQARVTAHNALVGAQAQAFHASRSSLPSSGAAPLVLYGAGSSTTGGVAGSTGTGGKKKKRKTNPSAGGGSTSGGGAQSGGYGGGSSSGYHPPRQPQLAPSAPAVAGTFQAWSAPGILGARPPAPAAPHTFQTAPHAFQVSSTTSPQRDAVCHAPTRSLATKRGRREGLIDGGSGGGGSQQLQAEYCP